jgi:predicted small metal-binding protein
MNIAFKEEFLKNDKDIEDARHLRNIYKDKISETLINDIKKQIRKLRMKK